MKSRGREGGRFCLKTPIPLPSATLGTKLLCEYTPNTSQLKEKSRNFLVHFYSGPWQELCPRLSDLFELGMIADLEP